MAAISQFLDLVGPVGFPLVLLALAVGVAWLVRTHPVGAVIRNTIAQAIRVKAAFAILAVYLVLVPLLPFVIKGDGTLRGQLHVIIGYSLIAAGLLLGILTLAMSTTTLWSEINEKQVYLIESKPLRRWQLLAGKLLGILTINAALLVFMAVVTWTCVTVLSRRKAWDANQRFLAQKQVLTARRIVQPEPLNPRPYIEKHYDKLREELERRGLDTRGMSTDEVKRIVAEEMILEQNAIEYGEIRTWRFAGLKHARRPKGELNIRLKFACSDRNLEANINVGWAIGDPRTLNYVRVGRAYKADEEHEEPLPARLITPDGVLDVRLHNIDPRNVALIFGGKDAMQVLVPVGGFASNLGRGLWLIFVEVLFLAVLGLVCSTFLSFPVSPVVALAVYLVIFLAGSIHGEMKQGYELFDNKQDSGAISLAEHSVRIIVSALRLILPPLDKYSAAERVSAGEEIPWLLVLDATFWIALVRGGILLGIGAFIFERRELALASR